MHFGYTDTPALVKAASLCLFLVLLWFRVAVKGRSLPTDTPRGAGCQSREVLGCGSFLWWWGIPV